MRNVRHVLSKITYDVYGLYRVYIVLTFTVAFVITYKIKKYILETYSIPLFSKHLTLAGSFSEVNSMNTLDLYIFFVHHRICINLLIITGPGPWVKSQISF